MKKAVFILVIVAFFVSIVQPVGAVEKGERKWQDESVYLLMIDRFNNGDQKNDQDVDVKDQNAYHGGDFQGIIDQLDYIQEMGFTSIALTPIFANEDGGYHGYWVNDFYKTDEHFGSIKTFKKLIEEVHNRNMKVIVDLDVIHVGENHSWVTDPAKKDWLSQQNNDGLPMLNLENAEVRQYLIEMAKWWIEETDIDGYRLYSVNEAPTSFWSQFSKEVKGVKSNFFLLGNAEVDGPSQFNHYEETGIDGFANYPLNNELREAFVLPDQSFSSLLSAREQIQANVADPYLMGTFMDSEKIVRFTHDLVQENEHPGPRWKQALTFLYTTPGIPIVLYGSEIALEGGEGADNVKQMNFRTDRDLIDYMTKIGKLRSELPSLTRGQMEVLYEEKGVVVYKRMFENETSVVAINNSTETKTMNIPVAKLEEDKELRGLLNGGLVRSSDGEYVMTIDRDMSEIFVLSEKTSINISYIIAMSMVLIAFTIFIILIWKRSKRPYTAR